MRRFVQAHKETGRRVRSVVNDNRDGLSRGRRAGDREARERESEGGTMMKSDNEKSHSTKFREQKTISQND